MPDNTIGNDNNCNMIRKSFFCVLVLLPLLSIIYFIKSYGVDIPYADQWDFVLLLEKLYSGQLTIGDLWSQHNEHRLFFPKVIMLALGYITSWDIRYEFYVSVMIAAMMLLVLCSLLQKNIEGRLRSWILVSFSFLIFSASQEENWTWGWQIQIFLNVFAAISAIWAMDRWKSKGVVLAIAFAVVSSYSFNNGLLIWGSLILLAILQKRRRREVSLLLVAFIATTAFYYWGYTKPAHHPSLLYPICHPYDFTRYVLTYLGSPLCSDADGATVIGIVLVGTMARAVSGIRRLDRKVFSETYAWLVLALYAFGSACVTGIGRAGFGVRHASSSRYVTISNLFVVSVIVMFVIWAKLNLRVNNLAAQKRIALVKVVAALLIASCIGTHFHGLAKMAKRK